MRSHLGLYGTWHRYRLGEPWRRPEHQATLVLEVEIGSTSASTQRRWT